MKSFSFIFIGTTVILAVNCAALLSDTRLPNIVRWLEIGYTFLVIYIWARFHRCHLMQSLATFFLVVLIYASLFTNSLVEIREFARDGSKAKLQRGPSNGDSLE